MSLEPVDNAFWVERWDNGEIGFHRDTPHPSLEAHWDTLHINKRATVLVPLCGKSMDMVWLAEKGHVVIGVEVVQKAVEEFFAELGVTPTITPIFDFTVYESAPYRIFCGDIFKSKPQHMVDVTAVYDRASLVALPPAIQPAYAKHLAALTQPKTAALMVSLDYDQSEMTGPPFSTPPETVTAYFEADFEIELRARDDALKANDPLRKRGLTGLTETCYVLQRKAGT
ncbi:MAG: thiopurine S-methyltransferase [Pseudomonadota bacterium]